MNEEIMDYSSFKGLSQDEQIKVLDSLREKHTNKEIQKHWGIAAQTYYNLVSKLGVKKKEMGNISENVQLDEQELANYNKEVISYELFKKLVMDQKISLFNGYLAEMSAQELANAWGVPVSTIYNYKSRFKKKSTSGENAKRGAGKAAKAAKATKKEKKKAGRKKKNVEVVEVSDVIPEVLGADAGSTAQEAAVEVVEVEQPVITQEAPVVVEAPLSEVAVAVPVEAEAEVEEKKVEPAVESVEPAQAQQGAARNYGTAVNFEGEYTKEELKQKLLSLVELLEGGDRRYKMNVSLAEIK